MGLFRKLDLEGFSDEEGYIIFDGISSGDYTWKFTKSGYIENTIDTTLPGKAEYTINLNREETTQPNIPGFGLLSIIVGAGVFIYIIRR